MIIKHFLLLTVTLALAGCVTADVTTTGDHGAYAWDGLGRNPNLQVRVGKRISFQTVVETSSVSDKTRLLATLPEHSSRWWAAKDTIEREMDAKLARAMVICRGCLQEPEHSGSIRKFDPPGLPKDSLYSQTLGRHQKVHLQSAPAGLRP